MNFYQNILRKEKEQNEVLKKQKLKEVEHWAKAVKEEEKMAVIKYCETKGEEEMKRITEAIVSRR
eukprot:CAMPEP_0202961222 /NCGR_PEP_ID=MMETSP1396-20130829/5276_1 /ASSEMBLY_ACC=CAM_ASM_000872 /TAXON_ID= /ORGANISM="Pseudokeronopsis sp., Strain Brazil" /LENGTH=64 /DNA_ID=CAMNT_0049680885 /DNA_START=2020 /DNA_END=2214 /DNA_ORIENTATION=-